MISELMCHQNDFGPGFTREAEPIIGPMLGFSAHDCYFGSTS